MPLMISWQEYWANVVREAMRPDAGTFSPVANEVLLVVAAELTRLQAMETELRSALIAHRIDLHQSSGRPCPTCRQSAKALGPNAPGGCKGELAATPASAVEEVADVH
jgi:hypothetical protein